MIDEKGEKTVAVLSMKEIGDLVETARDSIDLRLIEEVHEQPRMSWEKTKQGRSAKTR